MSTRIRFVYVKLFFTTYLQTMFSTFIFSGHCFALFHKRLSILSLNLFSSSEMSPSCAWLSLETTSPSLLASIRSSGVPKSFRPAVAGCNDATRTSSYFVCTWINTEKINFTSNKRDFFYSYEQWTTERHHSIFFWQVILSEISQVLTKKQQERKPSRVFCWKLRRKLETNVLLW